MNVYDAIITRRSTRAYEDRKVKDEDLEKIIEAGRHAPSGGNSQSTHFIVIRNKEVMDELNSLAVSEFAKMEVTENMYRSKVHSINQSKKGNYILHYNAPVLILVANEHSYTNRIADCSCVLENMMVMANDLDLGTCWINQIKWLRNNENMLSFLKTLGLKDTERVYGGLTVGYPKSSDGLPNRKPLERTGNPVTFID